MDRNKNLDAQPLEHDEFLRLLLKSEREIVRYVMAIIPNATDAQEVFQETAVALWKQIEKYDPSEPFTPWACRFAANKAKEHLRKHGRWNGFLDEEVATMLLERRQQMAPALDRRMEPLRDCLAELPSENRTIIEQCYFEQKPVDEIACDWDRSAAAVYKSIQRIRVALMSCVNGKLAALEASS